MNKRFTVMLALLMAVASVRADEGMWMLPTLKNMNQSDMKKLGLKIKASDIYNEKKASIKDAVVHFGSGCTAEIISDRGLLVTNHHCGYSSIQGLSTPEHNYLEDGYWAMSLEEEIPVPGLTVTFLQSMTDITGKKQSDVEELLDKIRDENPDCQIQVTGFYNDNQRYIIVNKVYRDVRFVGAPPASAGKFGGETDNWMWPRHTCDFSMFRVYADREGNPADYSEENVPMKPKRFLSISLKGMEEGDFAMIMGYPGRTQRFQTAAQLEQMMEVQDVRIAARTVRQDVMWQGMRSNDTIGLQYANKYASSANGWKKWQGMRECFEALDVIGRQRQKEADFMEWVNAKPKRVAKYGTAIEDIENSVRANTEYNLRNAVYSESLGNIELLRVAQMGSADREVFYRNYNPSLDREISKAMVNFYTINASPNDSLDLTLLNIDSLFVYSAYTDPDKLKARDYTELTDDPAAQLNRQLREARNHINASYSYDAANLRDSASTIFTAGLMEWNKKAKSYPDANSTCRLTYGTIQGYTTKDGKKYDFYTNMKGVIDKEDPTNYEFRVPARQKELWQKRDFGQYAGPDGEVPTCFLTNLDITGGNSGSPVMDAEGNLIGLAFDGNWEAMSGDVIFEPELQRCICVDIRYVLWMMDKFGGAGYLLDEMNIVK
ncbi:MAG: S46 family peptidase [Bacteroidaceae bacterium]|nr:S46 family peptidase [Bacteroidaceae bacterium]